jgi:hypothetical protein
LPGEAQAGFHAGERVGRQAGPLLDGDAQLLVPVQLVRREGDEAEFGAWSASSFLPSVARAASTGAASPAKRVARRDRPLFIG